MGERWVAEYTASGMLSKISDLSFPDWKGIYWIGHLDDQEHSKESPLQIIQSQVFSRELDEDPTIDSNAIAQLRSALSDSRYREEATPTLKDGWWTSIRWRNNNKTASQTAPLHFSLADFEFPRSLSPDEQDILESIGFTKAQETGYDISWCPHGASPLTPAKTLVDLAHFDFGFNEALTWDGIAKGLGYLMDLIPEPVTRALLQTGINRYFHFHQLVLRSHQKMLLDALEDHNLVLRMTEAERSRASTALVYADSSLLTSWKWFWKRPESVWKGEQKKEQDFRIKSRSWLITHGNETSLFSQNFSSSVETAPEKWFSLVSQLFNQNHGPVLVLDKQNPDNILRRRIALETSATLVQFTSNFIPVVGGIVSGLYESILVSREDERRFEEARLSSELEIAQGEGSEWEDDIIALSQQKLNPLQPSRKEYLNLISNRRKDLQL